jgi:hypothetical protein
MANRSSERLMENLKVEDAIACFPTQRKKKERKRMLSWKRGKREEDRKSGAEGFSSCGLLCVSIVCVASSPGLLFFARLIAWGGA